jgi:hypothetical protein
MQMANDCARRFEGQDRDSFMSPNPCFARCVEEALRWTEEEDQNDNAWTSHVARPLCTNSRAEPRPAFSAAHPPTLTEAATATNARTKASNSYALQQAADR